LATLTDVWKVVPAPRHDDVKGQLQQDEIPLAVLEPDLDTDLNYAANLVVLTDRRLLAKSAGNWQSWALADGLVLAVCERGGVGLLDLTNTEARLAHWRFTAAQSAPAHRLVQCWQESRSNEVNPAETSAAVCPSCGGELDPATGSCPACLSATAPRSLATLLRLVKFAKLRMKLIIVGFLLTVASTAAGLVPPYLMMPLLDDVLIPKQNGQAVEYSQVFWYLGGLLAAALMAWVLDWRRSYVLARMAEQVSADLRGRTYAHLQKLSVEFFGDKRTGDLMSRVSTDTDRICNFLSSQLVNFGSDILMIIMTAIVLFTIDPLLALATLVPFPFIAWVVYVARKRLFRGYRLAGVAWADMHSVLADTIPGIRVVKAFAQEDREVERFDTSNNRVVSINDRVNRVWSLFTPTVTLLTTAGLLVVWAYASYRVFDHVITVGVLTAFLAYVSRFYARMESMMYIFSSTQRAAASAQRIFEILDRVPSVPDPVKPQPLIKPKGDIALRGVRFKYGTREVLHGIDLSIKSGEMIGLVGPSGAGKSTLINLICRFYDVAAGSIMVDGKDIRSFCVNDYRQHIGIVLQEPFLFYGTIADNIAYGKPGATREEIVAAARAARAHEFILRLPDGYDSLVGERGQTLSGGERQRISIARALLIDPRILILDEATSSVDTETEREIQAALETLIQGRTTIAIAHRLSTLRRANRLVVLEHGEVAEIGSHEELLKKNGTYARLHQAQIDMVQGHFV